MNNRVLIGIIIGILVIAGSLYLSKESPLEAERKCVASSCCHASSCVWEDEAPNCEEIFCSMSCEPETMDCGMGQCEVVDGECEVIWNE